MSSVSPPPYKPGNWLAGEMGRTDPASEAWSMIHWLVVSNKNAFQATGAEFELSPPQMIALRVLGGGPTAMGRLAQVLSCDSSNITGITDRLEQRELVRREADPNDRRVKMLVLTPEGEKVRRKISERLAVPPEAIAALEPADQEALRDILAKALAQAATNEA